MTAIGVKCVRGKISMSDCAVCSLRADHPCMLPADMLMVMRKSREPQPGRTEFTPSSLLECDRRTELTRDNAYYIDIESAWNMMRGTEIHDLIERNGTFPQDSEKTWEYPLGGPVAVIREKRLSAKVPTRYGMQEFTGKPDLIVVKRIEDGTAFVKISDYKTTTIDHALTSARRSNQTQLNMYAWLCETSLAFDLQLYPYILGVGDVVVEELEIIYTDLKRVRRFTSANYLVDRGASLKGNTLNHIYEDMYESTSPRSGKTKTVRALEYKGVMYERLELEPIDLLDHEDIEDWIIQRIEDKIEAKQELPPPLEPPNDWVCSYCPMQKVCFEMAGKELP